MTDSRCGGEMGGGAITDDAGSTFRVSEPLRKIPAPLLLVEDSRLVRLALIRWLDRYVECMAVATVSEAIDRIDRHEDFAGIVVDVVLAEGSGFDALAAYRLKHRHAPALVYSGGYDRDVVNESARFNARFLYKPFGPAEIAPFIEDLIVRGTGDRLRALTEGARHRWELSGREAQILYAKLRGDSREDFIQAQTISVNTYKTHVRNILDKTGYENLASLAIDLLQE